MSKEFKNIPSHIAFIMDGNGRWATKRGLPRNLGHKAGVDAIEKTLIACNKYGINYVTFFAFSTENWKREKSEIDGIFALLRDYLKKHDNIFIRNKIKLTYIGVLNPFPQDLKEALLDTVNKTKEYGNNMTACFALNYGGRDEIVRAVNKVIESGEKKVDEKTFASFLDTKSMPDPDIIVRTSGEIRLSNFMLYQMSYSELYFPKVYWPDFGEKQLRKTLKVYEKRERKYGGVKK